MNEKNIQFQQKSYFFQLYLYLIYYSFFCLIHQGVILHRNLQTDDEIIGTSLHCTYSPY